LISIVEIDIVEIDIIVETDIIIKTDGGVENTKLNQGGGVELLLHYPQGVIMPR